MSTATPVIETHQFQAETRQLLDLMIHSLYTNKEIFLRELISNASDALDRLRFEALTQPELLAGDEELEIRIESDSEGRTLTIHDNGIGMSHDEVIANIGTIAKSGTRELMEKVRQSKSTETAAELIGQFGVGFYSSFMVADQVTLLTRRAGEETATLWQSSGDGSYTVIEAEKPSRGTSITLRLKEVDEENGLDDFTDEWVISRIVKRYSDFVAYPIRTKVEREKEVEPAAEDDEAKTETVIEDKTLNSMKPIWTRPREEVTKEELDQFYKHISHDWSDPLDSVWLKAEGRVEYQALLFLPSKAPYDLFYVGSKPGLQLYVKKVLIMDSCEQLMPRYLRFIRGVVESPDLPLNISRETLQHDRHITQMRRWLTRKVLDRLRELQKDEGEKYRQLWDEFGRALKEGVAEDFDNKDRLLELLLFHSSAGEELTTLAAYVERMKEGQEQIYYLTGESLAQVEGSPHLEAFRDKGYEVLYLIDPVDELMMQSLPEYEGKRFKSVGKGEVALGSEEERKQAEEEMKSKQEELEPLLEKLQKVLDAEVKHVRLSSRLTASPVCLVGAEHDYSPQLERLLQKGKGGGPRQRRIMELNPSHPILTSLWQRYQADADDPLIADYGELLLGYGLLAEGGELPDTGRFNRLVAELMARSLGADAAAPADKAATQSKKAASGENAAGGEKAAAGKKSAGGGKQAAGGKKAASGEKATSGEKSASGKKAASGKKSAGGGKQAAGGEAKKKGSTKGAAK